jgi:L-ribulose-5-phosphate 4-epimerase
MATNKEEQLRIEVVKGAKALYSKGLNEDNEGNISIRNGKKEELFITPTANRYETLTKEQIVHMAFDGTPLSSGKLPSTEAMLHVAIYKSRPKVKCVTHTHSTYATMLSILRMGIPIVMEEQIIYLGGSIEISSFGEAHTEDIGQVALEALGIKNAALLANHGVVTCGKSMINAVKAAELVEKLAKVYWGILQVGEPHIIPKDRFEKFEKMFDSLFACYPKKMRKISK